MNIAMETTKTNTYKEKRRRIHKNQDFMYCHIMSNVAVFCVMCGAFNENHDLFIIRVNENRVILRCFMYEYFVYIFEVL